MNERIISPATSVERRAITEINYRRMILMKLRRALLISILMT